MAIITISREFGSGGRELGKRLADLLGFRYYDKEILEVITQQEKTNEWYAEKLLERMVVPNIPLHFGRSFSFYEPITQRAVELLVAERNAIRLLAGQGNCVIVGRGANVILKDNTPFNIFVYADMETKIKRCREYASDNETFSEKEIEKKIRQIDTARAKNIEMLSGGKWGDKKEYHLCVNTGGLSIKNIAPLLAQYAKNWLGGNAE